MQVAGRPAAVVPSELAGEMRAADRCFLAIRCTNRGRIVICFRSWLQDFDENSGIAPID